MAIAVSSIHLIIPIENIEKKYPGGFKKYRLNSEQFFMKDEYLVMKGAMSPWDMESLVKECEDFGLVGIVEKDGVKQWQDFCVVEGVPTLPCEWIRQDRDIVYHKNDKLQAMISSFSPSEWVKQFKSSSQQRSGLKEMRAEIFQQTIGLFKQNKYVFDGNFINLDTAATIHETYFFEEPRKLYPIKDSKHKTQFSVIEADCIETAKLLKDAGYNVCMLNMANRQNPGGGVLNGAGAQEENIFRRSNLFQSLYQFADYAKEYAIQRDTKNSYPLDRNTGSIYSKRVFIVRGSENNGYCFLRYPFELSIVSVPAINRPQLEKLSDGKYYIADSLVEPAKEKIRTILRICGEFNHDCLVLSAFGCGAFQNPPHHVARLFNEVFFENEFRDLFRLVVFAIIDDHNAWHEHNPEGNVLPFLREFDNNLQ